MADAKDTLVEEADGDDAWVKTHDLGRSGMQETADDVKKKTSTYLSALTRALSATDLVEEVTAVADALGDLSLLNPQPAPSPTASLAESERKDAISSPSGLTDSKADVVDAPDQAVQMSIDNKIEKTQVVHS